MRNIKVDEKGRVTYVMRTGKTFVRNYMSLAYAQAIINNGKNVEETDERGQGVEICVDDKYFFPAEPEKVVRPKKKEVVTDEVTE